jgi:hypothetical protein
MECKNTHQIGPPNFFNPCQLLGVHEECVPGWDFQQLQQCGNSEGIVNKGSSEVLGNRVKGHKKRVKFFAGAKVPSLICVIRNEEDTLGILGCRLVKQFRILIKRSDPSVQQVRWGVMDN